MGNERGVVVDVVKSFVPGTRFWEAVHPEGKEGGAAESKPSVYGNVEIWAILVPARKPDSRIACRGALEERRMAGWKYWFRVSS